MTQRMRGRQGMVLDEKTDRRMGRSAQRHNIAAAQAVAESVRSTLGPKGMDKMLVSDVGDVTVTNDGVTVLREMSIENPTAQMVIEAAESQQDEAGDGTTTAIAIAGELLNNAEDLLEQGVHPTPIVRGFEEAAEQAREGIDDIARQVEPDDEAVLQRIAETSMTGKGAERELGPLSELVVRAVQRTATDNEDRTVVDLERVDVRTKPGRSIGASRLIDGGIVRNQPPREEMPTDIDDASILLVETPITINQIEADATLSVEEPGQLREFIQQEDRQLRTFADQLVATGADVVLSSKTIDDAVQDALADAGLLAIDQVKTDDLEALEIGLDAEPVSELDFEALEESDLATADVAYDAADGWFVVEGDGPGVTLLARGSTTHVSDELERGIGDALSVVAATVSDGRVLPGGGAVEVELAGRLREYATGVDGREQLAVEAVADALEVVPRTLAENAGLDPIDALVELRTAHESGAERAGLDVATGDVLDTEEAGVVEPAHAKIQAISNAVSVATLVLRIDEIISATALDEDFEDEDDQGGPGGMGGMGGMM